MCVMYQAGDVCYLAECTDFTLLSFFKKGGGWGWVGGYFLAEKIECIVENLACLVLCGETAVANASACIV